MQDEPAAPFGPAAVARRSQRPLCRRRRPAGPTCPGWAPPGGTVPPRGLLGRLQGGSEGPSFIFGTAFGTAWHYSRLLDTRSPYSCSVGSELKEARGSWKQPDGPSVG